MPPVIRDVAAGLWIWRAEHPDWAPHVGWDPAVTSTCVQSGGEVGVIDALVPEPGADAVWRRLDDRPPTTAVVLKPDHVRDVDRIVQHFGARAFGRASSGATTSPRPTSSRSSPGASCRAAWLRSTTGAAGTKRRSGSLSSARSSSPTPLTERGGALRVWGTPWHEERVLPALRAILDLPFEHVIVAHGEPVHDRAAFERALELPPWVE